MAQWTIRDLADTLAAGPQAAASIGSGMVAQPISGLAGLFGLGGGPERAANAVGRVQDMLTYQPTNPYAQRALSGVSEVTAPIGQAFEALRRKAGDAGYSVAGPVGGAIGSALPDAVSMLPLGALYRGLKGAPQRFPLPNQSQAGAIVYHGSPHKFDRFDSSKIGTGEGAQAYGHGMYFADSPNVAASYREALTARNGNSSPKMSTSYKVDGQEYFQPSDKWAAADVANTMKKYGIDPKSKDGRDWLNSEVGARYMGGQTNDANALKKQAIKFWGANVVEDTTQGALYKVDLPDSAISNMLDWDAPLSKQPEGVRKALESLNKPFGGFRESPAQVAQFNKGIPASEAVKYPDVKGQTIYTDLRQHFGSPQELTDALRKAGVTGIRYLDGGSRGNGAGTSNYVVFSGNENLLKILERQ